MFLNPETIRGLKDDSTDPAITASHFFSSSQREATRMEWTPVAQAATRFCLGPEIFRLPAKKLPTESGAEISAGNSATTGFETETEHPILSGSVRPKSIPESLKDSLTALKARGKIL
jgi:hypothetical protein